MICRLLEPESNRIRSAHLFAACWDTLLFGGCKYTHNQTNNIDLFEQNYMLLFLFSVCCRGSHEGPGSWCTTLLEFWLEPFWSRYVDDGTCSREWTDTFSKRCFPSYVSTTSHATSFQDKKTISRCLWYIGNTHSSNVFYRNSHVSAILLLCYYWNGTFRWNRHEKLLQVRDYNNMKIIQCYLLSNKLKQLFLSYFRNTTVEDFYKYSANGTTGLGYYYLNTFDNLMASGMTLFELTVVNNWFILMNAYAVTVGMYTRAYFMIFYLVTMIVLTIVVSSFLEAFRFRIQYKRSTTKRDGKIQPCKKIYLIKIFKH